MGGVLVAVEGLVVPLKGAEGGDFDHLAAETHVHDLEAAADDPAAFEQALNLLRRGVGDHVEVLGLAAAQQVAQTAAHQIGLKTLLVQPIQHVKRRSGDLLAGDRMLVAGYDPRLGQSGAAAGTFARHGGQCFQRAAQQA